MGSFSKQEVNGDSSFRTGRRESQAFCFVLCFVLLIVFFGVELEVWAKTEGEIRTAIEDVLSQRHPTETKQWWRSLGPQAVGVITSMFKLDNNIYHQIRLVDALAAFEDPTTVEFLKEQAAHHGNSVVRRAAIRAIGLSQGVKEKEYLKQHLESADPHTRLATAKLLNDLRDPGADKIVRDFIKGEKVGWISTSLKSHTLLRGKKPLLGSKRKF